MATTVHDDTAVVKLTPIRKTTIEIPITGITPLIPHRWSEKSRTQMRDKQTGAKARAVKEAKNPEAEAEATLYRFSDGRLGMPCTAFKAATVSAARLYDGVTMTSLKAALFFDGEGDDQLVPIEYGAMTMREDTPRNSGGTCDLRYRYSLSPWSAILRITFIPALIDQESVVNLVDAGGNGGVGDWRPSAPKSMTGTFGRYEVQL